MKVFVAHYGYDYDAWHEVIGVFSTRESAEKAIELITHGDYKKVEEFEVDKDENH